MTEKEDLKQAILHLHDYSNKKWRSHIEENPELKICQTFCFVNVTFHIYKTMEMCKLFDRDLIQIPDPEAQGTKRRRGRILLPPIKDEPDFIPLLSIFWDFRDEPHNDIYNSISLDMIHSNNFIYSMRFDQKMPNTDHDYFHLQVNNRISGFFDPPNIVSLLPGSKPCVPLLGKNDISSISALIFTIASLYGFCAVTGLFHGAHMKENWYITIKEYKDFLQKNY